MCRNHGSTQREGKTKRERFVKLTKMRKRRTLYRKKFANPPQKLIYLKSSKEEIYNV